MTIHKGAAPELLNVNINCKYNEDTQIFQILWGKKKSQNLIFNAFIFKSLIITGSLNKRYSKGNHIHP
jgi:hypothetical protein